MANEWLASSLGELTDWASGGTPPKENPEYWGGDIPWISASSMKSSRLSESDRTLTQKGLEQKSRLARKNDVLLLVRGSELHKRIPIGVATRDVAFNQDVKALRAKNGISSTYLYYWLTAHEPMLLSKVEHTGIGAGKLDTTVLKALPVEVPPVEEQRAIAHILGTLDDKIELNRKQNETLEAMAGALFKAWFVDFEPVRAKLEGRWQRGQSLPGLPAHLYDLFPERLVESELGEIPEGWRHDRLASFASIKNGYAFKSADWRIGGVPVVKIGSVKPQFVDMQQTSFVDEILALEKDQFRLKPGDMLVGLTGYVGETGRVPIVDVPPMLNQRVGKFESEDRYLPFVFAVVRDPVFKAFAVSKAHGSAQPNVSTIDLLDYRVVNPGEKTLSSFCEWMGSIYEDQLQYEYECRTLIQLREALLPKLISGELSISDPERFIGVAV